MRLPSLPPKHSGAIAANQLSLVPERFALVRRPLPRTQARPRRIKYQWCWGVSPYCGVPPSSRHALWSDHGLSNIDDAGGCWPCAAFPPPPSRPCATSGPRPIEYRWCRGVLPWYGVLLCPPRAQARPRPMKYRWCLGILPLCGVPSPRVLGRENGQSKTVCSSLACLL